MRSNRASARVAVVLGVLALVTIPVGVVAAQLAASLRLLETLYAVVPAACVLGLAALTASRHARLAAERSVSGEGRRAARVARIAAWAGMYAGVTGALALGVYGILRWAQ